jgi:hypothetical protein
MTYVCPTWQYAADAHSLKLQRLQNRGPRVTGILDGGTPVLELYVAYKVSYVYDNITTEVILNRESPNIRSIGQGEAIHRKYRRL